MGDLLRSADLLICTDPFSMLNHEAAICGTPVLLTQAAPPHKQSKLFGSVGISLNEEEARSTVKKAAAHYEKVREKIAGDVDKFIEIVEGHVHSNP
jgi:hypothetical protein